MKSNHAGKMILPMLLFALIAASWGGRDMQPCDGAVAQYAGDGPAEPANPDGGGADVIREDGPPLAPPPGSKAYPPAGGSEPAGGYFPVLGDGGGVLQVAGTVYYYAPDPGARDAQRPYGVFILNARGETSRLAGAYAPGRFFASGSYVYTSVYEGGRMYTYRTHMTSGGWERVFQGRLEAVDERTGKLLFTREGAQGGLYSRSPGGERLLWSGDCRFLAKDRETVYFWSRQDTNSVICAIQSDGTDYRILTVNARDRQTSLPAQYVWHFEVCGDSLRYSVGEVRGDVFEGDFVRIGKDGGRKERARLSGDRVFFTEGEHLYFNLSWGDAAARRHGIYRTDGDYTGGILLGREGDVLQSLTGGKMYFSRVSGSGADLWRCNLDGGGAVTLFSCDTVFQSLGPAGGVTYRSVEAVGPWVYFTVTADAASESGSRSLTRSYRVPADGGEAQLLGEMRG